MEKVRCRAMGETEILQPAYDLDKHQDSYLLIEADFKMQVKSIKKTSLNVRCEVRLDLLPNPRIALHYFSSNPFTEPDKAIINSHEFVEFSLMGDEFAGGEFEALLFDMNVKHKNEGLNVKATFFPKSEPVNIIGNDDTEIDRAIFHLFNFLDIRGTNDESVDNYTIEQIKLESNDWEIEIQSLFVTQENIDFLRKQGGHRLTHIGGIKKKDKNKFKGKELRECADAVHNFLSFAKGGWCEPVCVVGYDKQNEQKWASWSFPHDGGPSPLRWFSTSSSEQLEKLFPLFMEKWRDKDWREVFGEVIYCYLNVNNSLPSVRKLGIVSTQTALETLARIYAKKNKSDCLTKFNDNSYKASEKLEDLFLSLGIVSGFPEETKNLSVLSEQYGWSNGPQALTGIRNSLAHQSGDSVRRFNNDAYYEAWNLGLWYLEMCILAICGYEGKYINRLQQNLDGRLGDVPYKV